MKISEIRMGNSYMDFIKRTRDNNYIQALINPRRACAAKVTVVSLCVCLFVCLSRIILPLQATRRLMSDINSFSATRA